MRDLGRDYSCSIYSMLGTDSKPAGHFKAVQMYLKSSGQFRSHPDGSRAVQTASKCQCKQMWLQNCPASRILCRPAEFEAVGPALNLLDGFKTGLVINSSPTCTCMYIVHIQEYIFVWN